ncbi:bifunctional 3-(3-hydroxy-phenyl)propionate/3-hydroxycinnamic acid hydroxylase [Kribbella kalugense]|uniref:3-(3-hydroxy-phenyl)propionate hydroxylase n=1 Tax=Kribbella kalugense TaxID=2512221 RepID=A0A4R7ZWU1_9ACTN|nr:bifunctional 3-(3-hydroxy-phenyl)propionate/3-hydroxycinnamic acid hydroxylase [Kribbella kalugense]TDW21368.1 3-(3-hydroxy-phenyl)propionate hydroxylase [Kribbella kalugense]
MPDLEAPYYDVVVVGYGPVGATAANLLGAAGVRTLVVDRATTIFDVPRAIHFDASILRVFQSIGLADKISAQCRVIDQMATYGAQGQLLSSSSSGSGADGWADHYSFYQPELEQTLRTGVERYANVDVLLGTTVTAVVEDTADVAIRWESSVAEGAVRAAFVIGADGAASTVRKLAGIQLDDLDFDEPWLVVDALLDGPHDLPEATSQMFCDPRRPTTVVPGPGRHRRWEFMLLPGEDPAEIATPESIESLLSAYVDPVAVKLLRASVYRFHALLAQQWRQGRVMLAGDAAHQTPPFLGQGMCHGIRDVQALAWRLRAILHGEAGLSLLDSYQPEREPQVREVIGRAVTKGREICVLDPDLAAARDRAVLERSAWGQSLDSTMMLAVTSGFIDPGRLAAGVVPQPLVKGSRLDDLLPKGFSVITDAPDLVASAEPLPATLVTAPTVSTWLDAAGARAALLRPDHHPYGFAATATELEQLVNRLRSRLCS